MGDANASVLIIEKVINFELIVVGRLPVFHTRLHPGVSKKPPNRLKRNVCLSHRGFFIVSQQVVSL